MLLVSIAGNTSVDKFKNWIDTIQLMTHFLAAGNAVKLQAVSALHGVLAAREAGEIALESPPRTKI